MSTNERIPEARLMAGLSGLAGPSTPGLLDDILAATARTRQRPAWSYPERWLPMAVITHPVVAPSLRPLWLLLVALLITALAVGGAIVGSGLLRSDASIPTGGAAVFVFSSVTPDGQSGLDIHTVRADGNDLRQLTKVGPGVIHRAPEWSPDGTRIAYRVWQDGVASVVVMDAGGHEPVTVATNTVPIMPDCMSPWGLEWSPDGSRLVFPLAQGCSGDSTLHVAPADGSAPATQLLASDMRGLFPAWSPDGTRIAFLGSEAARSWGLYLVDVGSDRGLSGGYLAHRIGPELGAKANEAGGGPQWSPDGSELAVTAASTGYFVVNAEGIHVVNPDDGEARLVIERAGNPMWSPDGSRLSFARTVDPSEYWNGRPCTVRIGIIDTDGTNERELPPLADGCDMPAKWSPDGSSLASVLIASTPEQPELTFHLGFVPVDGVTPPVITQDSQGGSWQPVAVPLPPAPSFPGGSATP